MRAFSQMWALVFGRADAIRPAADDGVTCARSSLPFMLTALLLIGCAAVAPAAVLSNKTHAQGSVLPDSYRNLSQALQVKLDRFVDQAKTSEETLPGVTVAISLPDGQSIALASGYADQQKKIPMQVDTRMPAGSIRKTWAAAVAMSLVHEGVLALDEPVRRWLGTEPWFDRLPNHQSLTLRQLLNHSGGLIDHVFESTEFQDWLKASLEPKDAHRVRSVDEMDAADQVFDHLDLVQYVLDQPPLFAPGQGFHYTDTGYILVGLIIEQATGKPYYQILQNRFLDPLGLTLTSPLDSRQIPGVAQGYCVQSRELFGLPETVLHDGLLIFNPLGEWTGGGVVSNSQDLVLWAKALFEQDVLPPGVLEDMLTSVVDQGKGRDEAGRLHGYGLGVSIVQTARGTAFRHGGFFPGYLSMMTYYPDSKVAIAMQINSDGADLEAHFNSVQDLVFNVLQKKPRDGI